MVYAIKIVLINNSKVIHQVGAKIVLISVKYVSTIRLASNVKNNIFYLYLYSVIMIVLFFNRLFYKGNVNVNKVIGKDFIKKIAFHSVHTVNSKIINNINAYLVDLIVINVKTTKHA